MDKWYIFYENECGKCCMNECDPSDNLECNCNNVENIDCESCKYKEVYTNKNI